MSWRTQKERRKAMGKMNDYQNGRMDGLLLAQKIVKDGGIEALDEEVRFRGGGLRTYTPP